MLPSQSRSINPETYYGYSQSGDAAADISYLYSMMLRQQVQQQAQEKAYAEALKKARETAKAQQAALRENPEYVNAVEYSQTRRPGFQEFGPNGQFYQPIYQPQYQDYAPQGPQGGQQYMSPVDMAGGLPALLQAMQSGNRNVFAGSPFESMGLGGTPQAQGLAATAPAQGGQSG